MKKFLSLLLALLLCLSFIVSCEKEEAPSSSLNSSSESSSNIPSSSGESSSSEPIQEPTSEPSSSSDVSSSESSFDKLTYDNGFPVFERPKDEYAVHNIQGKQGLSHMLYDRWIINDYESFSDFLLEKTGLTMFDNITKDTFDENFVVAIYRNDDMRITKNYSYSNLKNKNGEWFLTFEYTIYYTIDIPDVVSSSNSFDLVVIPRSELLQVTNDLRIVLSVYAHEYDYVKKGEY